MPIAPVQADQDDDGVSNDKDDCPERSGLLKYKGCPVPDEDGDGINDVFELKDFYNCEALEFSIFNRWGKKMFSSKNKNDFLHYCEMQKYDIDSRSKNFIE